MRKDPDARLPFTVDWAAWLANEDDTAASVEWIVPDGITQETDPGPTLDGGKATVWLSGGELGKSHTITCRITTTGGRIDDRSFQVDIRER